MVKPKKISIVVPVYNEASVLPRFHKELTAFCAKKNINISEIIYCDDGSKDDTAEMIRDWNSRDKNVKLLQLSRNFGKEYALTAGIAAATGDAIITMDGDCQHPIELLPKFIQAWKTGDMVVVGVRTENADVTWLKRCFSRLYYMIFNSMSQHQLPTGSTDYCLIDSSVQRAFLQLHEPQRITRALIGWLGFKRTYIPFCAKPRAGGNVAYSTKKLISLASNGLVSMSPVPLFVFGIVGLFITVASFLLGSAVLVEQTLLGDPLGWKFTGTAQLSILVLFLVGIILISQGLLSLYVSHIHNQTKQRPLYVVDYRGSRGLKQL